MIEQYMTDKEKADNFYMVVSKQREKIEELLLEKRDLLVKLDKLQTSSKILIATLSEFKNTAVEPLPPSLEQRIEKLLSKLFNDGHDIKSCKILIRSKNDFLTSSDCMVGRRHGLQEFYSSAFGLLEVKEDKDFKVGQFSIIQEYIGG